MNLPTITTLAGRIPLLGTALRQIARRYVDGSVVKINQGLAAGLLWKRHHRYVNGYWIGHYEMPIQNTLRRELSVGQVFYDVGANAGFFTLIAARLVGPQGKCVAFDPLPANCVNVREQLELNSIFNTTVVPEALGDREGMASFAFASEGDSQGHLGAIRHHDERVISVKVTTLDLAVTCYGIPNFIKIDVEGAEAEVLKGAVDLLQTARPQLLIELHGADCEREAKRLLKKYSYAFFDLEDRELSATSVLPHHFVARPS